MSDTNLISIQFRWPVLRGLVTAEEQLYSNLLPCFQQQRPSSSVFSVCDYGGSRYVGDIYQTTLRHIPEDRNLPPSSASVTMGAAGTLVSSTRLHCVTFQKTVILTLPEHLSPHLLTLFFPIDDTIFAATEISICVTTDRYEKTTLELTQWIICVGNRLTAEVALQVRILYFFYFVSMIHKMAASYKRNVFKVSEFPLCCSYYVSL